MAIQIALPFRPGQHRLKALGVKVGQPDLGPGGARFGQHKITDGGVKTFKAGVVTDDKGALGDGRIIVAG